MKLHLGVLHKSPHASVGSCYKSVSQGIKELRKASLEELRRVGPKRNFLKVDAQF